MKVRYTNPQEHRQAVAAKRLGLFSLSLTIGYGIIIIRSLFLMVQDNQTLETLAARQYRAAIQPEVNRSRILDRNGKELAISVPAWSLYADPTEIKDRRRVAQALAPLLKVSPHHLQKKLNKEGRFVWLERGLDAATIEKTKSLSLPGVYNFRENKRYYPNGPLAGHILGAVGVDVQALGGIELFYDRYLLMQPKSGLYLRDAKGRLYLASNALEKLEEGKGDVYLTLDKNLQFITEAALKQAVEQHQAEGGVAIILDPKTGAILAMANFPSFNPNQFDRLAKERWRNKALTDSYEPGSTFKVIFAAAALEEGLISLQEKIYCEEGAFSLPDGHVIHDHKPFGLLSLREIIQFSSNIGAYKITKRLGKKKMYHWIESFGFGEKTEIDFPSESRGLLRPYQSWHGSEEATIAFGQGIGATPLQMLLMFAAIANEGIQMQPHLVEKVVGTEGEILYQVFPQRKRAPIRPETAKILRQILKGVVEGGTAKLAMMEDYSVAGKTGTSQKAVPGIRGYLPGKYIASFIGFAPLDEPKLVGLVLIDEPSGPHTGGVVAAPVFKEMMLRALHALGVPPKGGNDSYLARSAAPKTETYASTPLKPSGNYFEVPNFTGATLRHVLQAVDPYPVQVEFKGSGIAYRQAPKPGTLVLAGSKIYVEFEPVY